MSFTVEYSDDGGSTFQTIQFGSFDVEYGLSDVLLAPLAAVDASRQAGASTGDRLRIQENGSNIFTGRLTTGGEVRSDGQTRLQAEHDIYSVFADSVSITVSNPTDEDVYDAALSAATGGGSYTLNYVGTATSLADDYDVDDRKVKRIFKDMTDRTDRVFYVGVSDTITVAPRGNGGQFADLNAGDGYRVEKYNPGDIDTVRNAVTVNGTGGEQVSATATDSTSISDYGRRAKVYNFSYIRSTGEASSMASELLIPDPLADAELLLGRSISNTTDLQVNTTIDFDDPDGSGASDDLIVEKQTISPGATTVRLGEGAGVSIANVRRDNQSVEDTTEPGSVYNTDRIADDAIDNTKIVDLSITKTKISDDAISTPKLQANAVEANNIAANEITAVQIDTLDLDTTQLTIGNNLTHRFEFTSQSDETVLIPDGDGFGYIGEDTQRMNFGYFKTAFIEQLTIDGASNASVSISGLVSGDPSVQPSTDNVGFVGTSLNAWDEMHAYDFIDASTGTALDGGDPLRGLAADPTPPDHCRVCDDDGKEVGTSISELTKTAWEICSAQQRRIESLESTVDDLESRLADLEAKQE